MKANLYVAIFNFICALVCAAGGLMGWGVFNLVLAIVNFVLYNK